MDSPTGFRVTAAQSNGAVVVRVEGDLDLEGAPRLRATLEGLDPPIVLDCANLEFLDSTGIAVLVEARRRFGDGFVIRNIREQQRRVVELVGLHGFFGIEE